METLTRKPKSANYATFTGGAIFGFAVIRSMTETASETRKAGKIFTSSMIVAKLFHGKRNGYFVDLAAKDAVRISNTYALETFFGWNGICLELNSVYWGGLAYRKCHVVAAVVGNKSMDEVQFNFPQSKAPTGGIQFSVGTP
eukprot:scaffold1736_cov127-Cylindrotheca_fusiformis.AAC.31